MRPVPTQPSRVPASFRSSIGFSLSSFVVPRRACSLAVRRPRRHSTATSAVLRVGAIVCSVGYPNRRAGVEPTAGGRLLANDCGGRRMALHTYGSMGVDWEQRVRFDRLREERLARISRLPAASQLGALLCFDMANIRYVTATHIGTW